MEETKRDNPKQTCVLLSPLAGLSARGEAGGGGVGGTDNELIEEGNPPSPPSEGVKDGRQPPSVISHAI